MPVDVSVERVMPQPRERVAEFAGDPSNAPSWYANIRSVEWLTPPPMRVGSRLRFEAQFMGRQLRYVYEIVELIPHERLVMRTDQGPFPMETTYEWEDLGGQTRMRLRNRGNPSGFSRLIAPLLPMAMRRATTADLARLERVLTTAER